MKKSFPVPLCIRGSIFLFCCSLSIGWAADDVAAKLKKLRVPEIAYDGLTLEEVVKDLRRYTRHLDPEGKGVKFLIENQMPKVARAVERGVPVLDAQGNPISAPPPLGQPGVKEVIINITFPQFDLSMEQVLDIVVRTADVPLTWWIEKAVVVFRLTAALGITSPLDNFRLLGWIPAVDFRKFKTGELFHFK